MAILCCVEVHLHLVEHITNNSTRYQYHSKAHSQNFQPNMASHSNTRSKGCNWKVRWWKRCSIRVTCRVRKGRIKIQVVDCWLIVDVLKNKQGCIPGGLPPIDQMACKYTEHRSYFLPRKQRASGLCGKHTQTWPLKVNSKICVTKWDLQYVYNIMTIYTQYVYIYIYLYLYTFI